MKKVLSIILGVCLLTSLSVSSFATSEVDTHSMNVTETVSHVHSLKTKKYYTEREYCRSNGGKHIATYNNKITKAVCVISQTAFLMSLKIEYFH